MMCIGDAFLRNCSLHRFIAEYSLKCLEPQPSQIRHSAFGSRGWHGHGPTGTANFDLTKDPGAEKRTVVCFMELLKHAMPGEHLGIAYNTVQIQEGRECFHQSTLTVTAEDEDGGVRMHGVDASSGALWKGRRCPQIMPRPVYFLQTLTSNKLLQTWAPADTKKGATSPDGEWFVSYNGEDWSTFFGNVSDLFTAALHATDGRMQISWTSRKLNFADELGSMQSLTEAFPARLCWKTSQAKSMLLLMHTVASEFGPCLPTATATAAAAEEKALAAAMQDQAAMVLDGLPHSLLLCAEEEAKKKEEAEKARAKATQAFALAAQSLGSQAGLLTGNPAVMRAFARVLAATLGWHPLRRTMVTSNQSVPAQLGIQYADALLQVYRSCSEDGTQDLQHRDAPVGRGGPEQTEGSGPGVMFHGRLSAKLVLPRGPSFTAGTSAPEFVPGRVIGPVMVADCELDGTIFVHTDVVSVICGQQRQM
ncbi:Cpa2 [Symbiodinium sp. CCMP2592]|nr:Cpa2 [Symbiodinium sp. CCMP2592]